MLRLLALFAAAATAGCASSGATPQPFPTGRPARPPVEAAGSPADPVRGAGGYAVAGTALSLRGAPYRNGGADPLGFDCSGFVSYVFAQHGYAVPRSVGELFRAGQDVALNAIQPGDLVFFDIAGSGPSHVGIAVGGDQFVHAPSTNGVVRVDRVGGPYWAARVLAARRLN